MTTAVAIGISLEAGCSYDDRCSRFAQPMFEQMASGRYDECAVQTIPATIEEWTESHRTARKRAARAGRRGYYAQPLSRELHTDEIHDINVSKERRQGRAMTSSYTTRTVFPPLPDYVCCRHAIRTSGVWTPDDLLVAYITMYRVGELALVSQILGHGLFERDDIMYLLFEYALSREVPHGPGMMVYNRWDSGEDGLRYFKAKLGFERTGVEWLP